MTLWPISSSQTSSASKMSHLQGCPVFHNSKPNPFDSICILSGVMVVKKKKKKECPPQANMACEWPLSSLTQRLRLHGQYSFRINSFRTEIHTQPLT